MNCFISYRREDTEPIAEQVYDFLLARFGSGSAFWDRESIVADARWQAILQERIERSDVVLALVGPDWLRLLRERAGDGADYVRSELEHARACRKPVLVLPVLGASMPAEVDLPGSLRFIAECQSPAVSESVPFRVWREDLAQRLLAVVPAIPPGSGVRRTRKSWWSRESVVELSRDPTWWEDWNFHDPDVLDALQDVILRRGDLPNVAGLLGTHGAGRAYAVEAVVRRLRRTGTSVRLARLDLDGYEPGPDALARYLRHQASRRGVDEGAVDAFIRWMAERLGPHAASLDACAASGVAYDLTGGGADARKLIDRVLRGRVAATRDSLLGRVLDQLAAGSRMVVHVTDAATLADPVRDSLLAAADRNADLVLLLSCFTDTTRGQVARGRRVHLLAFESFDRQWLEEALARRFGEPLPDWLIGWLHRRSGGDPKALASLLRSLLGIDVFDIDRDGRWRLSTREESVDLLRSEFTSLVLEPVTRLYASDAGLQPMLEYAALCGPIVPLATLGRCLELDGDSLESVVNLVDDALCEPADGAIFRDHAYQHPGFPDVPVYEFLSPAIPGMLLASRTPEQRAEMALRLLSSLDSHLPARTRAAAGVHLHVLRHVPDHRSERQHWVDELSWWVGIEDAEGLRESLDAQLRSGALPPDVLWKVIEISEESWPPYRRLVLVEALADAPDGVPMDGLIDFLETRAILLIFTGRYREAADLAEGSLLRVARGSLQDARFRSLLGRALRELGQNDEALVHLQEALAIRERSLGADHPYTLSSVHDLGVVLRYRGELAAAEPLYRRALEAEERLLGLDHGKTMTTVNDLAVLLNDRAAWTEAEQLYRRALAWDEAAVGPDHLRTLTTLSNLARMLQCRGELEAAEPLYRRAIEGLELVLGPEHPDTLRISSYLGQLLTDRGMLAEAGPLCSRAVEALERVLGPEHYETLKSANTLAGFQKRRGELAEAERLYRRTLEARERTLGPNHPHTLTSLNDLAMLLHDRGVSAEAESRYRSALEGRERVLGSDHPDTVATRGRLARLLEEQGRTAAAE